jgi:hypothetical protein
VSACGNWDALVDYWAGDLDAQASEALEEHVFGCEACAADSARVARIVQTFRASVPAIVSAEQLETLRARGLNVVENDFRPGERRETEFPPSTDLLIHRLTGLDLTKAARVRVLARIESTDHTLMEDFFAPFDRARGEVLIACQRHFRGFPPDLTFDVQAYDATGAALFDAQSYSIPHIFPE